MQNANLYIKFNKIRNKNETQSIESRGHEVHKVAFSITAYLYYRILCSLANATDLRRKLSMKYVVLD